MNVCQVGSQHLYSYKLLNISYNIATEETRSLLSSFAVERTLSNFLQKKTHTQRHPARFTEILP
jgi:hypothetical protein